MRYILLFFLLALQTSAFGSSTLQKSDAEKVLTLEKSDLEARSCEHFMYQGQYYDKEIELAYNRFRYYDPNDGRYISKDPIGLHSEEYGFYNYVSDPNSYIDKLGLVSKNYRKRDITDSKNHNGCEKFAKGIQKNIGGDVVRITPKGAPSLGGYKGGNDFHTNPGWGHHEVVVKNGKVYDAFTGSEGLSISDYKGQWEYSSDINFGF